MNRAVIGLGSNIDPETNIPRARTLIGDLYTIIAESAFVQTTPVGFSDQPDFINGALLIETPDDPSRLNERLKDIEARLGRIRGLNRFGPRTIDLDILVFNGRIVDEGVLSLDFLRQSVKELIPDLDLSTGG